MGVLDQLEREAREAGERREETAADESQRTAAIGARIAPALERASVYLEKLASYLNKLDRVLVADYHVDGLGEFEGMRQGDYRVSTGETRSDEVRMSFTCTGSAPLAAKVQGHSNAEALARSIRDLGLECRLRPLGARVMEVSVLPNVTARIVFAPDLEHEAVQLRLRNLPTLGVQRRRLAPERVDEALLDAVANLVLHEPSSLDALTDSVIDDERRADLHRQIERDRRRHDAEIAGGLRRIAFPVAEWFRRRFLGH